MNIEEARKEVENYLDYEGSISITAIATLYTAYEKQQKEIERLEARKYILNAETGEISQIPINNNYISKDKIKAKIEELDKQEKEEPDAFLCKRVLQSLLEKE